MFFSVILELNKDTYLRYKLCDFFKAVFNLVQVGVGPLGVGIVNLGGRHRPLEVGI